LIEEPFGGTSGWLKRLPNRRFQGTVTIKTGQTRPSGQTIKTGQTRPSGQMIKTSQTRLPGLPLIGNTV